jgi:hypothetical protein
MEKIIYWYENFEQGDWSGKRSCGGTLTSARLRLGSLPDGLTNDCGQINSMEHLTQTLRLYLTLCDERRINDRNGSTVKSIIYIYEVGLLYPSSCNVILIVPTYLTQ